MGQTREVELEHGRPVVEGAPEIAVHQVLDERPVLDPEGLVEPEVLAKRLDVATAGSRLHQENGGVAGQSHEHEDRRREEHERDDRVAESAENVSLHFRASSAGMAGLVHDPPGKLTDYPSTVRLVNWPTDQGDGVMGSTSPYGGPKTWITLPRAMNSAITHVSSRVS